MDPHTSESEFVCSGKIIILLDKLKQMSKKPEIDLQLIQVLDEFLKNFGDRGTKNKINFAEAALLLQNAGDVYKKKVDLLWDMVFDYQKRIIMCDEKCGTDKELEKVEERKRKYKRKRKTKNDEKQTATLVDNFSFGSEYCDYTNQHYESVNLHDDWNKFNAKNAADVNVQECRKFHVLPDTQVHNEDKDYVGKYNQFHSTSLPEDIFHLEDQHLLADDQNCVTNMRIDSYVINDFLLEKSIPSTKPRETYIGELNKYIKDFILQRKPHKTDVLRSFSYIQAQKRVDLPEKHQQNPVVIIDRLSTADIDKLRRASTADSLFDEISTCLSPTNSLHESINCEQINKSLDSRSKSCSQDSAFYDDSHMEMEENEEALEAIVAETAEESVSVASVEKKSEETETVQLKRRQRKTKNWSELLDDEDEPKSRLKRRKLSVRAAQALATGLTATNRQFELFYRLMYKTADDEGKIPESVSESEESESESDSEPEDDDEDTNVENQDEEEEIGEEPSEVDLPSTSQINFAASTVDEEEDAFRRNVREWRSFILPKLKSVEKRPDFNIHDYGSRIIEKTEVGQEQLFKDVVKGQSAAEVARFFVASLQLANTNNIEILGSKPGEKATNTFTIKTVDKVMHHENLEVSEEVFRENLESVKTSNPNQFIHSTPMGPPRKKPKLAKSSNAKQKKLFQ